MTDAHSVLILTEDETLAAAVKRAVGDVARVETRMADAETLAVVILDEALEHEALRERIRTFRIPVVKIVQQAPGPEGDACCNAREFRVTVSDVGAIVDVVSNFIKPPERLLKVVS